LETEQLFRHACSHNSCVEGFREIENDFGDRLLPDRGVNHGVVNAAVRPIDVEILLQKSGAFPVNRIY
jgi:hypothetical protein